MTPARLVDGLSWWLAGWKPGARPLVGALVALLCSLAGLAFWVLGPRVEPLAGLFNAAGAVLFRFGLEQAWQDTLFGLIVAGAAAQALISAVDLFAPKAVRARAASRALADALSAAFAVGLIVGFGFDPFAALDGGFQPRAWIGVVLALSALGQTVRALANLRQTLNPDAGAAPAAA